MNVTCLSLEQKIEKIWHYKKESIFDSSPDPNPGYNGRAWWSEEEAASECNYWGHLHCYNPMRSLLFTYGSSWLYDKGIFINPCYNTTVGSGAPRCQCMIPFYVQKVNETKKLVKEHIGEASISSSQYVREYAMQIARELSNVG